MKKKILFITTSRADYSQSKNLIKKLKKKLQKNFFLLVSGTHLSAKHGYTVKEILNDGLRPDFKIKILKNKNSKHNNLNSISELTFKKTWLSNSL